MRRPGSAAGVPLICVGNPTLGGAGKTPAALAIGRFLKAAGERPFFLSRGYGGRARGPLVVDPGRHGAREVGDEPLLLARIAPTVVARARPAGAAVARARGASVIVMDDGFQNPSLAKDFAVLVLDGRRGIGNARVFPAGPLRAPLEIQLERTQALIAVGEIAAAACLLAEADRHGLVPVTTEKDLARISGDPRIAALAARARAVPVDLVLDREAEFQGLVLSALRNQGS